MGAELLAQFGIRDHPGLERHEGHQCLALQIVRTSDYRGLGDVLIADERALDFRRADAMAGHVEHVIDTTHDPEVTVLVLTTAIAGEIGAFDLAPINFLVALRVAPESAQHARPRFANDELAAHALGHGIALVVHDL